MKKSWIAIIVFISLIVLISLSVLVVKNESIGDFFKAGDISTQGYGTDPLASFGESCTIGTDCLSGFCVSGNCTNETGLNHGSTCTIIDECLGGFCGMDKCSDGSVNNLCDSELDCQTEFCAFNLCTAGEVGNSCEADEDCALGFCYMGSCTSGEAGEGCYDVDDCESGLICNLVCMEESVQDMTCNDTDGGTNYYVSGNISGVDEVGENYELMDQCRINVYNESWSPGSGTAINVDNCSTNSVEWFDSACEDFYFPCEGYWYTCGVLEMGCHEDTQRQGSRVDCPNGCAGGACLPYCSETDLGFDPFNKSSVEFVFINPSSNVSEIISVNEVCFNETHVTESNCSAYNVSESTYPGSNYACSDGCFEGACIDVNISCSANGGSVCSSDDICEGDVLGVNDTNSCCFADCVECLVNDDCSSDELCSDSNSCVDCLNDADCASDEFCSSSGSCKTDDSDDDGDSGSSSSSCTSLYNKNCKWGPCNSGLQHYFCEDSKGCTTTAKPTNSRACTHVSDCIDNDGDGFGEGADCLGVDHNDDDPSVTNVDLLTAQKVEDENFNWNYAWIVLGAVVLFLILLVIFLMAMKGKSGHKPQVAKPKVNPTVYDYLVKNSGKYPLASLKSQVIAKGYSEAQFDAAAKSLKLPK